MTGNSPPPQLYLLLFQNKKLVGVKALLNTKRCFWQKVFVMDFF
jgi:hypothetical protein